MVSVPASQQFLTFIGFQTTFLVQHWLGDMGMPRRYADYLPSDGFQPLNVVSTIGAFILGASMLVFIWNVFKSWRYGEPVTVDDPWGYGNSLEWATSCPPPRHNFTELPRIRPERPAFELHYPHMVQRLRAEAYAGRRARLTVSPHPRRRCRSAPTRRCRLTRDLTSAARSAPTCATGSRARAKAPPGR
jgi:cytochrome c oxidase subunit 1